MRTEMMGASNYPPLVVLHVLWWVMIGVGAVQVTMWIILGVLRVSRRNERRLR